MDIITTKKQLEKMREELAKSQGLECGNDARCYHCKNWGYNRGGGMNDRGQSRCSVNEGLTTDSHQWCKHFDYVSK